MYSATGFEFGFDKKFGFDPLKTPSCGAGSSAHVTPAVHDNWQSLLDCDADGDAFGDRQATSGMNTELRIVPTGLQPA
ncbi:hypothetical protein LTR35_017574 [Friedmanniomyces endolithicus]|nr:hypothetical protein LTS09_017284 [Friedmanniomyces endolithicus]KAK0263161.1 hypothetical protein LTR35_017574 [Friedmanniomyces endolithicus]KAK0268953.1 hypothetical protein LTS00_017431 [Friedmanniomyces endolithicus]